MFSSRKKVFESTPNGPADPQLVLWLTSQATGPVYEAQKNSPRGPLGVRAECHRFFFMQEIVSRNVKFRHPNKCRFQYRVQKNLVVSFCSACCNGLAESIHAVVVVLVLRGLHFFGNERSHLFWIVSKTKFVSSRLLSLVFVTTTHWTYDRL